MNLAHWFSWAGVGEGVDWIWRSSWQAGLLVLVVLLVQRCLGSRLSASWRHGLWWIVLLRLTLPWLPSSPASVFNLLARVRVPGAPAVRLVAVSPPSAPIRVGPVPGANPAAAGRGETTKPARSTEVADPVAVAFAEPKATAGAISRPSGFADPGRVPGPWAVGGRGLGWLGRGREWESAVAVVWAVGALLLLARLWVRTWGFARRLRRESRPVTGERVAALESCRVRMGVRTAVTLWEVPGVESPAMFGIWRPRLLLPPGSGESFTASQWRHVFLHELAHVRRGDLPVNLLMSVLHALHWFNPVVVFAFRRMRQDREIAADALALTFAGEAAARDYGRTLVQVLEERARETWQPGTVGIAESAHELRCRIRAIAGFRRPSRFAPLGGAAVFLGLAAVTLTGEQVGPGTSADPARAARVQFVGFRALADRPGLADWRAIGREPETRLLLDQLTRQIADHAPPGLGRGWEGAGDARTGGDRGLRAWLASECLLEVGTAGGQVTGWAAAARLNSDDANEWESRIRAAARLSFARTRGWTVLGGGAGVFEALRARLEREGAGAMLIGSDVLRANVDLGELASVLGWQARPPVDLPGWPRVEGAVHEARGGLRTEARLSFAGDLNLSPSPWQVPTNLVRDPLVGFTAVQDAERWYGAWEQGLGIRFREWPKQLFVWERTVGGGEFGGVPWRQHAAGRMDTPEALVAQLAQVGMPAWQASLGWSTATMGLRRDADGRRAELVGLPYFQPSVSVAEDVGGRWLLAGLSPATRDGRPLPEALAGQLRGRTNLVFYDWETTGRRFQVTNRTTASGAGVGVGVGTASVGRLLRLKELAQYDVLMQDRGTNRLPMDRTGEIQVPCGRWIDAVLGHLGDSVTEVRKIDGRTLEAVRQSATGLTAREWMAVLRRLGGPPGPGAAPESTITPPPVTSASASKGEPLAPGMLRVRARAIDATTRPAMPQL